MSEAIEITMERLTSLENGFRLALSKLEGVEKSLDRLQGRVLCDVEGKEKDTLDEIRNSLMPYIERLKGTLLSQDQQAFLDLIEEVLLKTTTPFLIKMSSPELRLSPQETQVARLVRDGKSNKEIAELLHLSISTILTHRHHVRAKLGLRNQKKNLRSFLQRL